MTSALGEQDPPDVNFRSSGKKFAVNAAAGGASNILKVGVQLVMLPLMAHLLGPSEFGLYALALPTVNLFMTLADAGLGLSLAREDEDASSVWSTAFWLLLLIGVTLSLLVGFSGVIISLLAHEARLTSLMAVLSVSFIFVTTSILPSARLTRRNRLVVLAASDFSSTLLGAILAVGIAVCGGGAWSLAAQYVGGIAFRAVVLNCYAFVLPSFTFKLSLLKPHVSTGGAVLGGRLADFAGRLAENVLFGRSFGAAALGSFTFANQAPRFLCEALSGPVWGALYAHAILNKRQEVVNIFLRLIGLLSACVFPLAFLLSASAVQIIPLLLGSRWANAVEMFQILIIGYAFNAVASQCGALLLANGRGGALFSAYAALTAGRVAAVTAGIYFNSTTVNVGITVANLFFAVYMFSVSSRVIGIRPLYLLNAIWPALLSASLAWCICRGMIAAFGTNLTWIGISICSALSAYCIVLFIIDRDNIVTEMRDFRETFLNRH